MRLATLEAVFRALDRANVRYLIAGGVAVNAHGFNRATHDIDLVVQLDPSNVISAMQALTGLGFRPALPVSAEEFADSTRRRRWIEERNMQVFSLVSDDYRDAAVDIFASEPFDFDAEFDAAMVGEVAPGLNVRFIRLETLIAMKEITGRPRDRDDAAHLREILSEKQRVE
jgi:predicted nucleotidyltransferase